jgi:hypothetical protein
MNYTNQWISQEPCISMCLQWHPFGVIFYPQIALSSLTSKVQNPPFLLRHCMKKENSQPWDRDEWCLMSANILQRQVFTIWDHWPSLLSLVSQILIVPESLLLRISIHKPPKSNNPFTHHVANLERVKRYYFHDQIKVLLIFVRLNQPYDIRVIKLSEYSYFSMYWWDMGFLIFSTLTIL